MSIIQEALKRAQYNYAGKKRPPQAYEKPVQEPAAPVPGEAIDARAMTKKIAVVVYLIVLLALVTGFGMRALFSKMVAMDKEKRSKDLIVAAQENPPDKAAPSAPSPATAEQAIEKPLAMVSSAQTNQVPSLVLNGIMYTEVRPKAIINGTVVREGDVISGATVTSITRKNVLLKYNNDNNQVEVTLKLKE
ncbi:MAG: general secretion pathway protein GspB [Candidatus Omnitrophota bacterium]|nr:general secretion pathway protein GspB [Candidatus Omnitrophota bacterium]